MAFPLIPLLYTGGALLLGGAAWKLSDKISDVVIIGGIAYVIIKVLK